MNSTQEKKKTDKTVLCITDFSKSSTQAILFATTLFNGVIPKIQLLNIFDTPSEKDALLISVEDILSKDSEASLKKQAAEIASVLKISQPNIATYSVSRRLKKIIGSLAQNGNIDLIIAGIATDKYPCKQLNAIPLLFISPGRVPVLLVPEKSPQKPVDNIVILRLDARTDENDLKKELEQVISPGPVSKNIVTVTGEKTDKTVISSIYQSTKEDNVNLFVISPEGNDAIDRALLDYRVHELLPSVASLLNC